MKKLLIIEDDSTVAHIYKQRLSREGYEVQVADDGQNGFYKIQEYKPDAVLMDLMLPRMNGVDILKKIRLLPEFAQMPVLVFTNAYVPNMVQDAITAGASDVFDKASLTPRRVIDAVQKVLFGHKAAADSGAPPTSEPAAAQPSNPSANPEASAAGQPKLEVLPTPVADPGAEALFEKELLKAFGEAAPETVGNLRRAMQAFIKAQEDSRLPFLLDLYRRVHALTSHAGISGMRNIAHLSSALEVLLKESYEKPRNITPSTLRTVAHAIDFLSELFTRGNDTDLLEKPAEILVVDDEILSRRAITYALEKANLKAVSVEDGTLALNQAQKTSYDLVFLDVQMPGMDGFELCTQLRTLDTNRHTPVIFVTSLNDFKSRARSSLSGGNDFIAKPFMFIELSVKALTYVMKGRLALLRMQEAA